MVGPGIVEPGIVGPCVVELDPVEAEAASRAWVMVELCRSGDRPAAADVATPGRAAAFDVPVAARPVSVVDLRRGPEGASGSRRTGR